jgi:signal transduction histidine kinase
VRELRSLVVTITPPQLHVQGLAETLADLVATLEVRGIAVTVSVSGTERLDEATETLVYRAAQEAVRNIVRHADASSVTLTVTRDLTGSAGRGEHWLELRVRDNGCGFDAGGTEARSRGSVGLELLSALVTSHGGTLTVNASPGKGTELAMRVPVEPMAAPARQDGAREKENTGVSR